MTFIGELRVESTRENLMPIAYFMHGIGHRLHLAEETLSDLELAVEEAATNIIEHAYPDGRSGDILIRAETSADMLRLEIVDWGKPIDLAALQPFDRSIPIERRARGGIGLELISQLVDTTAREIGLAPGQPNRLILTRRVVRALPGEMAPGLNRELNALQTVTQVMATAIDLDDLLKLIIDKLVEAIDAERGTLYLIDEKRGELYSKVLLEDRRTLSEIRVKIGEGFVGHVAASGQVLNVEDAYRDPRFNRSFDQATGYRTESILTAPMHNPQQKIIGVVQVLNKRDGPFTERDERMLVAMAAQAAISIETARLHAQEIRQQLMHQELKTAQGIQESFLPSTVPHFAGWDIAACWHPARDVAGDFYDFQPLGDGRWSFVIADVCGKGVPAALFMALSVTVLRFAINFGFTPPELLLHANRSLLSVNQQSRTFATIFVGYLDFRTGFMQCSSAGHNPPLLYRAATHSCEYVKIPGVLAGMFDDLEFVQKTIQLEPGDVLLLYTDGITEAANSADEEFGEARLEAMIADNALHTADRLVDLVIDAVAEFSGERGAFDDETLVVIKRSPSV